MARKGNKNSLEHRLFAKEILLPNKVPRNSNSCIKHSACNTFCYCSVIGSLLCFGFGGHCDASSAGNCWTQHWTQTLQNAVNTRQHWMH